VFCQNSSLIVQTNKITGNSASWGGGIASMDGSGSVCVSNNTISHNSAIYHDGAGIFCAENDSTTISNNTIRDNDATHNPGGGILCFHSRASIFNNLIIGNSAGDGGGIYCTGGSPVIVSNTILNNSAQRNGGGICCVQGGTPTIIDCIVTGNGDDLYNCSATYCCIEAGEAGTGNIRDDPMFVTGPLGEFYLHPDSPCIDAGSQSAEDAGLSEMTTQADGMPDTGTVDMGYHYPM